MGHIYALRMSKGTKTLKNMTGAMTNTVNGTGNTFVKNKQLRDIRSSHSSLFNFPMGEGEENVFLKKKYISKENPKSGLNLDFRFCQ